VIADEIRLARLLQLRQQLEEEIDAERARRHRARTLINSMPIPVAEQPLQIVAAVIEEFGVTAGDLGGPSRITNVAQARAATAWIARSSGCTVGETAAILDAHRARVHAWVSRVEGDPALKARAAAVRDRLATTPRTSQEAS